MANNKTLVISQSMSWIKRKYEIQGTYYHQNKVKKKGKKKTKQTLVSLFRERLSFPIQQRVLDFYTALVNKAKSISPVRMPRTAHGTKTFYITLPQ